MKKFLKMLVTDVVVGGQELGLANETGGGPAGWMEFLIALFDNFWR